MPAVEVADKFDDLLPAGHDPRDTHRHQRRLGPAVRKPNPLGRRHHPLHPLAPLQFKFVAGGVMRPARHLFLHSLNHRGMPMTEQQRSVTDPVVDDRVSLDRHFARPVSLGHVNRERFEVSPIVRDTTREECLSPLE